MPNPPTTFSVNSSLSTKTTSTDVFNCNYQKLLAKHVRKRRLHSDERGFAPWQRRELSNEGAVRVMKEPLHCDEGAATQATWLQGAAFIDRLLHLLNKLQDARHRPTAATAVCGGSTWGREGELGSKKRQYNYAAGWISEDLLTQIMTLTKSIATILCDIA